MNNDVLFTVIWFNSLVLFLPLSMVLLYKWPALWHHLLSIFLGLITGIMNFMTDEVQFPALLLLVFGFFLGFSKPKGAWQWALLLGLWVPLFQLGSFIIHHDYGNFMNEGVGSLLALIPAFLGTSAGVLMQYTVTKQQHTNTLS